LRIKHPDWVREDGESPITDSYESLLVELLDALERRELEGTKRVKESFNQKGGYAPIRTP
jgi:molecular chaperone GrpE (heat shock protein)